MTCTVMFGSGYGTGLASLMRSLRAIPRERLPATFACSAAGAGSIHRSTLGRCFAAVSIPAIGSKAVASVSCAPEFSAQFPNNKGRPREQAPSRAAFPNREQRQRQGRRSTRQTSSPHPASSRRAVFASPNSVTLSFRRVPRAFPQRPPEQPRCPSLLSAAPFSRAAKTHRSLAGRPSPT